MIEQRSDSWFQCRAGKVTASRLGDLMATTKSGPSASRKNYIAQLVVERMTGQPASSYSNAAMQWGVDTEPMARARYELVTGRDVVEEGFIVHPEIADAGASPDGLVGDDGMLEIKCPTSATHIETLLHAAIDRKYMLQMQFQMACAKRQWVDFVSFDPRMPDDHQIHIQRVSRDDKMIAEIEKAVTEALSEIEGTIARLNDRLREAA